MIRPPVRPLAYAKRWRRHQYCISCRIITKALLRLLRTVPSTKYESSPILHCKIIRRPMPAIVCSPTTSESGQTSMHHQTLGAIWRWLCHERFRRASAIARTTADIALFAFEESTAWRPVWVTSNWKSDWQVNNFSVQVPVACVIRPHAFKPTSNRR